MKDIRILPAEGEEGAIYARMLQIELEDAGYSVAIGIKLPEQVDFRLAVVDVGAPGADEARDACRLLGIPCVCCGSEAGFDSTRMVQQDCDSDAVDNSGYFPRPIVLDAFLAYCARTLSGTYGRSGGGVLPQAALFLGTKPSDAAFRGKLLGLTPREYALLTCLYTHYGQTVTREALFRQVWGSDGESASNVVDACAKNLRKKLDERFGLRLIHAVRGKGYRLLILPEGEAE